MNAYLKGLTTDRLTKTKVCRTNRRFGVRRIGKPTYFEFEFIRKEMLLELVSIGLSDRQQADEDKAA
jgi:hypothetical protein